MLTRRAGLTLVELLVSMTVGGVVLAMIAGIALRQQRVFGDLSDRNALSTQLRDAAATLPIDLHAVSPVAGDIRDARDSALELRATIASAIVCDSSPSAVVLAPAGTLPVFASFTTPVEAGDTAWVMDASGAVERWSPARIASVATTGGAACAAGGPTLSPSAALAPRTVLTLAPAPAAIPGTPLRVTRPTRYSVYKASDGSWYLGGRDWNNTLARFNGIQPIAGPLLSAASGGLAFRYFDSTGAAIASPVSNAAAVALVRVELRGQSRNIVRALGAASTARFTDSAIVAVALRNRR